MKSPLYKSQISGQNLVKFTQKISLAMGLGESGNAAQKVNFGVIFPVRIRDKV
jgi:hypothetical protein